MVAMLLSLGWQVDAVASGTLAVELVQKALAAQTPYQAIFTDWQMPDMDGWRTTQRIRELTAASVAQPLVLMITAHGRENLSLRSAQEQAMLNGFLVKPVTSSMLFDAVMDARAADSAAAAGQNPAAPKAPVKVKRLKGMRLLVVEDNKINQLVAKGLLAQEGADVTLAENGQLGVDAVAHTQPPFDAVLMDVQMPVMDGYEATRAIRTQLGLADLPIIAMTANAMASDRLACLAAGMNDHVGKPFDLDHLVALLIRCAGRKSATASVTGQVATDGQEPITTLLPGEIDVAGTLERMGGNTSLLGSVLRSFARDLSKAADQMRVLLSEGAAPEARRAMHTLKGLAATVGARHLAQVAADLERRLERSPAPADAQEMARTLQTAIDATAQSLVPVLRQYPADEPVSAMVAVDDDPVALVQDLRVVCAMLERSDMDAVQAHARMRLVHGATLKPSLDALDASMNALDFQAATAQYLALLAAHTPGRAPETGSDKAG
jgi:CheY-like chemotaxis protein